MERSCLAQCRAIFEHLEDRQLIHALGEPLRYGIEHRCPLRRWRPAPQARLMRCLGRGDRPVGMLAVALGHAGHELLGSRAADLESVNGIDPVPVDEHRVAPHGVHPGPFRCDQKLAWRLTTTTTCGRSRGHVIFPGVCIAASACDLRH